MTFDTPKEVAVKAVVANTLNKLHPADHAEAVKQIAKAAATGQMAKDLMGSDVHHHTDTVVDHTMPFPSVSSSTTSTVKTPEDFMPAAKVITSVP
jgi:hypothetical protein